MELIASAGSELLDLSMRHESIHFRSIQLLRIKIVQVVWQGCSHSIFPSIFSRLGTAPDNLAPALHRKALSIQQGLESDFFLLPPVGQDSIKRYSFIEELSKLKPQNIKKTHVAAR